MKPWRNTIGVFSSNPYSNRHILHRHSMLGSEVVHTALFSTIVVGAATYPLLAEFPGEEARGRRPASGTELAALHWIRMRSTWAFWALIKCMVCWYVSSSGISFPCHPLVLSIHTSFWIFWRKFDSHALSCCWQQDIPLKGWNNPSHCHFKELIEMSLTCKCHSNVAQCYQDLWQNMTKPLLQNDSDKVW